MINRLTFGAILILCFSMCNRPKDIAAEKITSHLTTFRSDYDTLQNLGLPLILDRTVWRELSQKHYDNFGVKGGDQLLTMPFGKLIDTESYKGIVFIYDNPILITIDRNKNPIDTLFLLGDDYSNDPSISTIEQAKINSDFTIILVDSVFTYDLGDNDDRIEDSRKLMIKTEKYKIENAGEIKRIE